MNSATTIAADLIAEFCRINGIQPPVQGTEGANG